MKHSINTLLVLALVCLVANEGWGQNMSNDSFDRLKKLEGTWEGTKPNGEAAEVSYEVMSGGSALVETLNPAEGPEMVTVYHRDGDRVMMTHYCSAGNQPKMVASKSVRGEVDFDFVGATNLGSKSEGHMKGLKIIFVDENHFKQIWTWSEDGKQIPNTFEFQRVK